MTALSMTVRAGHPRLAGRLAAVAAVAAVVGVALTAAAPELPGTEQLTLEDLVDAAAGVAAGVLGWVLVRRGVAVGLGRALIALAVIVASVWLTGGLADLLAAGAAPAPPVRGLQMLAGVLFIPSFVLLVLAPLLLFPDGRLPGRAARPLLWLGVAGTGLSMLAMLLHPGPVDEDVPAWGANPFGVHALRAVTDVATAVALVLLAVAAVGAVVAFVVRLVRSRGVVRRQMLWLLPGVVTMIAGLVTGDVLPGALSATIIFAMVFGGMAWALLGPPAGSGSGGTSPARA
jgi:two-component system, NarL family, sensor kinase